MMKHIPLPKRHPLEEDRFISGKVPDFRNDVLPRTIQRKKSRIIEPKHRYYANLLLRKIFGLFQGKSVLDEYRKDKYEIH